MVGVHPSEHIPGFGWIPLQARHDRLQVPHLNMARPILVKQIKDVSQILHLVISKVIIIVVVIVVI